METKEHTAADHRLAVLVELYAIEKCCWMAAQLVGDEEQARLSLGRVREFKSALVAAGVPL